MRNAFQRRLSLWLRLNAPFLMCFFLLIMGLIPWRLEFVSHFAVPFVYIPLFYWTVFKPDLVSPLTVFLLGLCADLLTISPLGYHTFLFLLFYWVVLMERRAFMKRSFLFLWLVFGAFTIALSLFQWLLASLLNLRWLSLLFFTGQGLLLFACFPVLAFVCAWVYQRYLDEV